MVQSPHFEPSRSIYGEAVNNLSGAVVDRLCGHSHTHSYSNFYTTPDRDTSPNADRHAHSALSRAAICRRLESAC
jgi:hypothetical protein